MQTRTNDPECSSHSTLNIQHSTFPRLSTTSSSQPKPPIHKPLLGSRALIHPVEPPAGGFHVPVLARGRSGAPPSLFDPPRTGADLHFALDVGAAQGADLRVAGDHFHRHGGAEHAQRGEAASARGGGAEVGRG